MVFDRARHKMKSTTFVYLLTIAFALIALAFLTESRFNNSAKVRNSLIVNEKLRNKINGIEVVAPAIYDREMRATVSIIRIDGKEFILLTSEGGSSFLIERKTP